MNDKNLGLIILDNGGGITLQMGDYAHYYQDAEQAAEDIIGWLVNPDTSDYEGHEEDAASLEPSDDEIRNGGYRIIRLDRETDKVRTLAREIYGIAGSWANGDALQKALGARLEVMRGWTDASAYDAVA